MPHLELQAAVMAGRLANTIISEHRIKTDIKVFWCDSTTVLDWTRNDARKYKAFAHHLGELEKLSKKKNGDLRS